MGISAIYFNPIFEASSNHKYDTADYLKIDPMFGDNDLFRELCRGAAELGISIILDGVFSHTGSDSIYFNKEGNYASLGLPIPGFPLLFLVSF
ncbi:MAG: alpha-amylase family glycosyl hydrolase [Bacillota bacterium]|nr:alpha-amylase family glycosyl hydrolase [Bacillota bacterium]